MEIPWNAQRGFKKKVVKVTFTERGGGESRERKSLVQGQGWGRAFEINSASDRTKRRVRIQGVMIL